MRRTRIKAAMLQMSFDFSSIRKQPRTMKETNTWQPSSTKIKVSLTRLRKSMLREGFWVISNLKRLSLQRTSQQSIQISQKLQHQIDRSSSISLPSRWKRIPISSRSPTLSSRRRRQFLRSSKEKTGDGRPYTRKRWSNWSASTPTSRTSVTSAWR